MKELIDLFLTFAKVGVTTFGGGYAMLPILQREVAENRGWASEEELMDYYAIGQCTPGVIAVNTATFIGYKYKGIAGGIVATIGCIFPSMIIITIIAALLKNFASYPAVIHALNGIRACVCALILDAIIKLGKKALVDITALALGIVILLLSLSTDVSVILFVVAAAIVGITVKSVKEAKKLDKEAK